MTELATRPTAPTGLADGTLVRITSQEFDPHHSGHRFGLGEIVRLANGAPSTGGGDRFEHLDGHDYWFVNADEYELFAEPEVETAPQAVEEEELQLGRPTIDFSGPSRATAREYAAAMPSEKLDDAANEILADVACGRTEVDAYALNRALLSVMRLAATRFRNSVERREFTTKVAHLGHIVQAVMENHADRLPAYEKGVRSRKIETLEGERAALTQAASDERRRLCAEIDGLRREKALLEDRVTRLQGDLHATSIDVVALREQNDGYVAELGKTDERIAAYQEIAQDAETEAQAVKASHLEYRAAANTEITRLLKLVGDRTKERDEFAAGVHEIGSVLVYAIDFLPCGASDRVLGYWDGLTAS